MHFGMETEQNKKSSNYIRILQKYIYICIDKIWEIISVVAEAEFSYGVME